MKNNTRNRAYVSLRHPFICTSRETVRDKTLVAQRNLISVIQTNTKQPNNTKQPKQHPQQISIQSFIRSFIHSHIQAFAHLFIDSTYKAPLSDGYLLGSYIWVS